MSCRRVPKSRAASAILSDIAGISTKNRATIALWPDRVGKICA
jgi:hypothetical protein